MKNILITGATSAIGIEAIKWCRNNYPSFKIIALGRNSEKLFSLEKIYGITTVLLDFSLNEKEFIECIKKLNIQKINIVFHFLSAIPEYTSNSADFYKINFINARIFFDSILLADEAYILNTSTASIYDQNIIHISEMSPKTCTDDYGISKLMFENYLENKKNKNDLNNNNKLTILNARIPILIVPDVKHNFISKWLASIQNSQAVTLFNSDKMFNSCVWGEDIFDFFKEFSVNYKNKKLTCNVGAGGPITILEAFQILMELNKKSIKITKVKAQKPSQYYDSCQAMQYGYKPRSVREILYKYQGINEAT